MKEFYGNLLLILGVDTATSADDLNPYNMEAEDGFNILSEDSTYLLNEG